MATTKPENRRRFRTDMRSRTRALNRAVLLGSAVFLPLYLLIRFTGGSAEKLEELPDLLSRIKTPIVWEVPEDVVRYERFFHGTPDEGYKFVVVRVQMKARMKIGYPIVPKCFRLVDDEGTQHFPMQRSPLFINLGNEFYLDHGETFEDEVLFQIPDERGAERLLFDRYQG